MRAKCLEPTGNRMESYNGKDLVTKIQYKLDLNKEYEPDLDNRIVDEKNVETKYYMALRLLGCVYTDVLLKFLIFSKYLIELCNTERRRSKLKDETKKKSWGILIAVLLHLEKCQPMTEYMFTALQYIIGLIPLKDYQNSVLIDATKIATFTKSKVQLVFAGIRNKIKNMSSNGSNEDDKDYKLRISKSSKILLKSINNVLNVDEHDERGNLVNFKSINCVEPAEKADASISEWLKTLQEKCKKSNDEEFVSIIDVEVQKFIDEMVEAYYSDLGFVYGNGITTLSTIIPSD
ncbi:uncharacterized protein LOC126844877 [Adelges cooleyi]|uniref:uncharacterized protein LOC126844877 n=1 Tax=Adelges cooleyi TaxID=133065 RepID=UPI00217FD975|nr:uncharacterized protein LOC126844877 [Adelges cooleyi]